MRRGSLEPRRRLRLAIKGAAVLAGSAGPVQAAALAERLLFGPVRIRAVHYHATPPQWEQCLDRHLRYFAQRYVPVAPPELRQLLENKWQAQRPGLLLSFDDGLSSNYHVASKVLERYGWRGWFFVPAVLADGTAGGRETDAAAPTGVSIRGAPASQPDFMNLSQLRDLSERGHVIGCHTLTHQRLGNDLDKQTLTREVVIAREVLRSNIQSELIAFAWVGGERSSVSAAGERAIRGAGFQYAFLTNAELIRPGMNPLRLNRTHLEAWWPLARVRFSLSPLMDLLYWRKRRDTQRILDSGNGE